jgi:hypothetical protein
MSIVGIPDETNFDVVEIAGIYRILQYKDGSLIGPIRPLFPRD